MVLLQIRIKHSNLILEHASNENLKIIFFDDINGQDNDILQIYILDVRNHHFLRSVTPNINILYIPIFQLTIQL